MRTVAIIQARLASSRLPGKVLYELAGLPIIGFMAKRVQQISELDELVLATGEGERNDPLADIAQGLGITVFRGSEDDVLSRFYGAAEANSADIVIRLTGDCPLADASIISDVLQYRAKYELDYCTNVKPPSWPDGLDVSVFTMETLCRAAAEAQLPSEREHVVPWMWKMSSLENGSQLAAGNVSAPEDYSAARWTVDDAQDYLMLRSLAATMGPKTLLTASWPEIMNCLSDHPEITAINASAIRDAGLAQSRLADYSLGEQ